MLKSKIMQEILKDITGYEGYYQVSNFGNVKSLSRFVGNGNTGFISKEKTLKPILSSGYLSVALCKNGKTKSGEPFLQTIVSISSAFKS